MAKSKVAKHTITQEDLDTQPELTEQGLKVGDEVEIKESSKEKETPKKSDNLTLHVAAEGETPTHTMLVNVKHDGLILAQGDAVVVPENLEEEFKKLGFIQ